MFFFSIYISESQHSKLPQWKSTKLMLPGPGSCLLLGGAHGVCSLSHVLGKDSAKGSEHGIQSMGQRRLHHLRLHTLRKTFQFSPPLTWLKLKASWIWDKNDGEKVLFLLSWSAKLHARFLSSHNVNSVFLPTSLLFYSTLPSFSHSLTFIYWALSFEVPNRGRTKQ